MKPCVNDILTRVSARTRSATGAGPLAGPLPVMAPRQGNEQVPPACATSVHALSDPIVAGTATPPSFENATGRRCLHQASSPISQTPVNHGQHSNERTQHVVVDRGEHSNERTQHVVVDRGQHSNERTQHVVVDRGEHSNERTQHVVVDRGQHSIERTQHVVVNRGQHSNERTQHVVVDRGEHSNERTQHVVVDRGEHSNERTQHGVVYRGKHSNERTQHCVVYRGEHSDEQERQASRYGEYPRSSSSSANNLADKRYYSEHHSSRRGRSPLSMRHRDSSRSNSGGSPLSARTRNYSRSPSGRSPPCSRRRVSPRSPSPIPRLERGLEKWLEKLPDFSDSRGQDILRFTEDMRQTSERYRVSSSTMIFCIQGKLRGTPSMLFSKFVADLPKPKLHESLSFLEKVFCVSYDDDDVRALTQVKQRQDERLRDYVLRIEDLRGKMVRRHPSREDHANNHCHLRASAETTASETANTFHASSFIATSAVKQRRRQKALRYVRNILCQRDENSPSAHLGGPPAPLGLPVESRR
jgi:hypothetical protein